MIPKDFPQANCNMQGDHLEIDGERVGNLRIYRDRRQMISCWRPTFWERLHILFFGKVWLWQYTDSFPPTAVVTEIPWANKEEQPA